MKGKAGGCAFTPMRLVPVLLGFGLLVATGVAAQNAVPERPPVGQAVAATEAVSLELLAAHLAARRSELDARRQRIARELDRLSAIDSAAGEAELALWRDRASVADRLERDIEALRALIGALTPKTLQEVSPAEASAAKTLAPAPALLRTTIDVNLRAEPGVPPFAVAKADTLVVQLATDAGGWSLVAAPSGVGFVPVSQLRREP